MTSARYFDITTLPAIGDLGTAPPMKLADLIEHVVENRKWLEPLKTFVLLDDLHQREAVLAGEIVEVEPAVLSLQQMQGEARLPAWMDTPADGEKAARLEVDQLWDRYFRYAHRMGVSSGSRFLTEWVEFEVALRNKLAAARARKLGLGESDYQVATDLIQGDEDLAPVLSEWETAATPLAGLRVVIQARWSWIDRHDAWFSFSMDELLAYAARVMLLEQWRRTDDKDNVRA
jgi:hypothetical protein